MNFELRELRWTIHASGYASLRQAADALHIRQSTLSWSLRGLEYEFGQELFEPAVIASVKVVENPV